MTNMAMMQKLRFCLASLTLKNLYLNNKASHKMKIKMMIMMIIRPVKVSNKFRSHFQIWKPEKKQNTLGKTFSWFFLKENKAQMKHLHIYNRQFLSCSEKTQHAICRIWTGMTIQWINKKRRKHGRKTKW
jgi:hypothetical protein